VKGEGRLARSGSLEEVKKRHTKKGKPIGAQTSPWEKRWGGGDAMEVSPQRKT